MRPWALGALQPLLAGTGRVRRHRVIGAIVLGLVLARVGHAVLTEGALDGAGTALLLALGAAGLLGIPAAHHARIRRRSR